ncbi:hypothetical protein [Oleiharenicola lentus]|uniref:hypothetical protein n=1 Tax=Oleiharenicola lentus TaxID=2508720 RepID=UPI003F67DE3A
MRYPIALFCALIFGAALRAEYQFSAPDWAIEVKLEAKPSTDQVSTPSPQGDVKATRYFLELSGENYLLVHFVYPLAMIPGEEPALYDKSLKEMMKSRPGKVTMSEPFALGPYDGYRIVISQPRERTTREIRMVVIGSSLYIMSAEYPAADKGPGSARATRFFSSLSLNANFADMRAVDERERWRELAAGNFRLRYDAARWYRDPSDTEPGIYNLVRADQKAEAQLIIDEQPVQGNIEDAVLQTAREGADSVSVKKRGKKMRGLVQMSELQFLAQVEKVTYLNHGYFYSGREGAVQLRSWATQKDYPGVAAEMEELLDGLQIGARAPTR